MKDKKYATLMQEKTNLEDSLLRDKKSTNQAQRAGPAADEPQRVLSYTQSSVVDKPADPKEEKKK